MEKWGMLAVLEGGDHNTDAWGPECENPTEYNFGRYQEITELWWQFFLNGNINAGQVLKRILDRAPWETQYAFSANFEY
jgi:hypothetical protein